VRRPPGLRSGESVPSLQNHQDVTLCRYASNGFVACVFFYASKLQRLVRLSARCQNPRNPYRPIDAQTVVPSDLAVDPEGDAQDVHRFSMRQGCLIEKSRLRLSWQFRIGRGMFSLVTFFAPKKVTRAPARKRSQASPARHESSTPIAPQKNRWDVLVWINQQESRKSPKKNASQIHLTGIPESSKISVFSEQPTD
jgi:hypothetical protein